VLANSGRGGAEGRGRRLRTPSRSGSITMTQLGASASATAGRFVNRFSRLPERFADIVELGSGNASRI
jgi:hypothetical protein